MTCAECKERVDCLTRDGIAVEVCGCGEHAIPRIAAPRRARENPIPALENKVRRPLRKKYRRVSMATALEIRKAWARRPSTFLAFAAEFGVNDSTISRIIRQQSHRQAS